MPTELHEPVTSRKAARIGHRENVRSAGASRNPCGAIVGAQRHIVHRRSGRSRCRRTTRDRPSRDRRHAPKAGDRSRAQPGSPTARLAPCGSARPRAASGRPASPRSPSRRRSGHRPASTGGRTIAGPADERAFDQIRHRPAPLALAELQSNPRRLRLDGSFDVSGYIRNLPLADASLRCPLNVAGAASERWKATSRPGSCP